MTAMQGTSQMRRPPANADSTSTDSSTDFEHAVRSV